MKNVFLNVRTAKAQAEGCAKVNQMAKRMAKILTTLTLLLTLGVGQMWGNGGIGYKGVKFTKNGSATGWYNIHNVSWDYYNSTYDCRSGQSGVTDFNNANLGTVTTLKLKAFVVIGWTDNSDYVAGQLKWRLYKQSASAGSYNTVNVGNYGSSSNSSSAADVLASSGKDRVVGNASLTTDIVTSSTAPGNYYLQLQGLGRMQWANGSSHGDFNANNGSEVKASLLVPGFTTTSTSNAFGSVNVGSNSSTTISFTQHYGTALTTSNCALSGTNSSEFEVTGISETGVTVKFKPSSAGSKSATLTITDAHSKTCTITLTGTGVAAATRTLTYHANYIAGTGSGTGSVPAAQTVAVNANATVAGKNTLAFVNYTFSGWDTEEHITGTHYDKDDEITMDTDKDLYAVWTRTIPLDDQGATTAVTGDVYGTYNSSSLPSFTNPAKTGYTFQGWYTQIGGGGNFVINTSRVFQASKTNWTNASCQFIRPSTSTSSLYAKWTQSVTLKANTANHGSGTDKTATVTYNSTALTSITHCTPATDYELEGYYTDATSGTKILNADGTFAASSITNYITSSKWTKAGATTLYAQYTPIPVKLLYGSSTPLNSPTDGGAMSYDATEHAYYKDVTTNSSPYYFRFDYNSNSEQYSGNWSGDYPNVVEATGDGTKVDCNQTVKGWGNKASIKYTGANGSSIRIWFDFQNKKAWITETTYSVTVAAGAGGSVSTTSVSGVGATTASGDITATPDKGYVFTGWTLPSGTSAAAGYTASSNPIRINATAGSKTITANFAAATAFIEGRFHITNASRNGTWTNTFGSGDWDENSTRIKFTWDGTNNRYELHTYAKPKELTTQIGGYNPVFYVKESSSSSSLANVTSYWSSTSQTLTAAGTGNKKSLVSSGTFHNDYLRFNSSDESGYTVLYFDEAGVWYELEQTLKYNANGGTGSTPAMAYYMKGTNATAAPANTYTKVGYNFSGWKTAPSSGTSYAAGASVPMNSNITLYAQWTPKTTTVSFNANTSAEGYRSGSAPSNVTATYNAAMPSISIGVTAQDGYACIGYFDDPVDGTQYYDGTGTSVKNWDKTGSTATLYAHYAKAQITALTFSPSSIVAPNTPLTVTVTIAPTPTGTTAICWRLLQNNDNPVYPQPDFTWDDDDKQLTFNAPATGGTYKLEATLRLGSGCSGDVLDQVTTNLVVANDHTVTVLYHCGDATIKSSTEAPAKPLVWTSITAPDIVGYTFSKWKAGDGVTIEDADANGEKASATINYKAIYDGTLTAIYTQKRMIYFYNTLGWENVYVYFYKNDSYWDSNGSGSKTGKLFTDQPYSEGLHGQMLPVSEGSNIYYFDAEGAGVNASYDDVVFTEHLQHDYDNFWETNVVRRGDYKTSMPMFVPVDQTPEVYNTRTNYYNKGYWMNYPENTGYTLRIYSKPDADNATGASREYLIPYSADKKMPLKQDVEINFSGETWFLIYRNDGYYLQGSEGHDTFKQTDHDDEVITGTTDATTAYKLKVISDGEGIYTFNLSYHDDGANPATYNYYINVDFPAAVGDYRIVYKDNATWSRGAAHGASWYHPSKIITKIKAEATEAKKDTVSFFISYGSSPSMKFQKIKSINASTGVITWEDVSGGSITIPSSITEAGVYNFIISQSVDGTSISLEKAEPYTGKYYIRTDCAGNTKWNNYKSQDHQMTYTEFSRNRSTNTFGELYTHYYAHWCERSSNIQFVIANDYSPCISDTLAQDVGNPYDNTDAAGTLKTNGAALPVNDRYSANVRFMYNETTNKICRAYVASSTDHSRLFLVLRGNAEVRGDDNEPISDEEITNGVILDDQQNWIYERELKILPGTRFKLFACYAEASPTQANAQYFRGAYDSDKFDDDDNSVILVDGNPAVGYQKVRIIYDFKTNRLVSAWLPDNSSVTGDLPIHADVMVIREHQEAAKQITFTNTESKLSEVLTVYGAMKFNRWVLNNKSTAAGHAVLDPSDQKSIYERALYFISFPFDVNLSEVFGFGTYGVHWIIEYYDGLNRAKNGYWIDSPPNWKFVTNPNGYVLEAKKGYILCLDLEEMKDDNEDFWVNGIETIELFFPSTTTFGTIQQTNATTSALGEEYRCTINRGDGTEGDRRIKDSFWRCIGVPSFANYSSTLSNGTSTITWQTGNSLPYLYEWNMTDNTLTPQGTSNYAFKAMHAYLAQCQSAIVWTATSSKPAIVAARNSVNEMLKDREFRLQLNEKGVKKDQTYVRLSMDEAVTTDFEFGNDMSKELNSGKSNIYTWIGSERVAANSLPLSTEQTTIVPVGVVAYATGDYTFAIPDGTEGIGVTLVDSETGIRTQLGALDYTVTLNKGTYDERFYLEISPISNVATDVELINDENGENGVTGVRKVIIDQNMYIIRDGKMYDARGARVE